MTTETMQDQMDATNYSEPLPEIPYAEPNTDPFNDWVDEGGPVTEVNCDGYIIDTTTGEVLGHVEQPPKFCVTDQKSADWVLRKMMLKDASVSALTTRITALQAELGREQRDRDWLEGYYGHQLEAWAKPQIAEKRKGKYIETNYARLGLRSNPSSIKVMDVAAAVKWIRALGKPELTEAAVKVEETVRVTPLQGMTKELPTDIFNVTAAFDKFYIKTGSEAK